MEVSRYLLIDPLASLQHFELRQSLQQIILATNVHPEVLEAMFYFKDGLVVNQVLKNFKFSAVKQSLWIKVQERERWNHWDENVSLLNTPNRQKVINCVFFKKQNGSNVLSL